MRDHTSGAGWAGWRRRIGISGRSSGVFPITIVLLLVAWRLGFWLLPAGGDRRSWLLREWSLRGLRRQHINQAGLAGLLLLLLPCGLLLRLLHGLLHSLLHLRRNR